MWSVQPLPSRTASSRPVRLEPQWLQPGAITGTGEPGRLVLPRYGVLSRLTLLDMASSFLLCGNGHGKGRGPRVSAALVVLQGSKRRPYDAPMAAAIVYVPRDDRGKEILDELEEKTQVLGAPSDHAPDAREYHLMADAADVHAFEPMLDGIAPDWPDHLTLASPD
jgi:hypothetical protein